MENFHGVSESITGNAATSRRVSAKAVVCIGQSNASRDAQSDLATHLKIDQQK